MGGGSPRRAVGAAEVTPLSVEVNDPLGGSQGAANAIVTVDASLATPMLSSLLLSTLPHERSATRMAKKKPAKGEDPQQYILKKDFKKAAAIYRDIIKADPDDPNPHIKLGDCLVSDSQSGAAIPEYRMAAKIYAEQGFLLKAIGVNKKIVKLDPSQEDVHHELSKLYEERGLLASPKSEPSEPSAPAAPVAPAGGGFQFDMEESSGDELGIDIDREIELGSADAAPTSSGTEPAASASPDSFGLDDLGGDIGDALAAAATAAADPAATVPEPAADESPSGAPAMEPVADVSIDELSDALSDLPADTVDGSTLEGLGFDLTSATGPAERAIGDDSVQRTPLFSDFTADELVEVVKKMEQQTIAADTTVVKEGDPGDSLYVIVHGSVRVLTTMKGNELKLADLGEGAFFGEGSLITGRPRTATIVANDECELLTLDKAGFDQIVATHPRVKEVMRKFYEDRAESTVKSILQSKKG